MVCLMATEYRLAQYAATQDVTLMTIETIPVIDFPRTAVGKHSLETPAYTHRPKGFRPPGHKLNLFYGFRRGFLLCIKYSNTKCGRDLLRIPAFAFLYLLWNAEKHGYRGMEQ